MSDQQPPQSGDTAAVAGPDVAPGTAEGQPEVNWEKRYQDLQPEYTRATQRLSEMERERELYQIAMTTDDPDTQRQALEALGYELPDEESPEELEPVEWEDPNDQRLSQVEQRLERMTAEQREQAQFEYLNSYVDEQVARLGLDQLDEDTRHWILHRAINMPVPQGPGSFVDELPDVEGAYKAFQDWETARQRQWAQTKRSPYVPPGGQEATEAPDLSTHEGRVAHAMQKIAEHADQG